MLQVETPKPLINVVWLKRDLRTQDHEPLQRANASKLPYLIIYLFEPSIISYPDTSLRHLQFIYHSIQHINNILVAYQQRVHIIYAEALAAFTYLQQQFRIKQVFSYQESGIQLTYNRDKQMARWFAAQEIDWLESQRDGIGRKRKNREGWDKAWFATMHAPVINNAYQNNSSVAFSNPFALPLSLQQQLQPYPKQFQPAGEKNGWRYLRSFVEKRGLSYHYHISKPDKSRYACGRISPYLAWGNLSIRQIYQFVKKHPKRTLHKRPFTAFLSRLKWHCHFIQKFEMECSYETACLNKGYELLEHPENDCFINAWKEGKTGYPLVDACMRCVTTTGWINFRMRAMLVSFLCHHLYQDWRTGTYHLAQQFLDYEPGIHYPQFQMQAGTTGVNTVRIYNPTKQAQDHDPEGVFIKKWVPELEDIPKEYIHQPHLIPPIEQALLGFTVGKDYPLPIVDLTASGKHARDKIWGHRKHPLVQQEKVRIVAKHTRNFKKPKSK